MPLAQLVVNVLVLDNGAGNQLGKQGDKGAEVDDVFLGARIAAVHVDGVRHGLEGIKGNADGQRDSQRLERQAGKHRLDTGDNKVIVLEKHQTATG